MFIFLKISLWNYSLQFDFVGISESADTVKTFVNRWVQRWFSG